MVKRSIFRVQGLQTPNPKTRRVQGRVQAEGLGIEGRGICAFRRGALF